LSDARGCGSSSNTFVVVRSNRSAALGDPLSAGFFFSVLPPTATQASGAVSLIYAGATILAIAVVTVGIGLLRAPHTA